MANLDAPNGFSPSYHRNGGVIRYEGGFKIASGLASDIFAGDLVIIDAAADGTHIDVGAAASTRLLGVFAGCQYTAANGDVVWQNQWASGTATKGAEAAEAFVYTDQNIVYTDSSMASSLKMKSSVMPIRSRLSQVIRQLESLEWKLMQRPLRQPFFNSSCLVSPQLQTVSTRLIH